MSEIIKGKLEHCILIYENGIEVTSDLRDINPRHLAALHSELGKILLEKLNEEITK